ncbi:uncharacterized protein LOC110443385 [Mizuhopecten yessoensis]|uniref:Kazal-like domain-containing protein n=1 Tax=Mizuhopecten yessoensis TaxID=6573 RepID=A0A210R0H3_MIZYE|nr:uncharacterized protein LOC110443385 [Mizuhopecten yessoensis]OWF54523.1 hypothetical protein KP79_PYT13401 [Mizuhopecten yessoensis]
MEVSWLKVACYLLFLCTVISAVRMPHGRDFHRKQSQHVTADRTALTRRTAVVPPPNVPHTEGTQPKPVRQPWYRHIGADTRQTRHRSHTNNRRLRVHKHFDEIAIHNIGSKPELHDIPKGQGTEQHQDELSRNNELSDMKIAEKKNVDETVIPNIDAMLHRHSRRMNKLKRKRDHIKRVGRRGRQSRRKLSSFQKGCRMRKACSIRTVHYRPVCGSDGVMYDNRCMLKVAACMKGSRHAIKVTNPEACQQQRPL